MSNVMPYENHSEVLQIAQCDGVVVKRENAINILYAEIKLRECSIFPRE